MDKWEVLIEECKIADVFSEESFLKKRFGASVRVIDVDGAYIAPGLIDTHIHGFQGHGT